VTLNLNADHLQAMRSHAEQTYPDECCGLLLGRSSQPDLREVVQVQPMQNAWSATVADELGDDPTIPKTRRYWIDPPDLLQAMRSARSIGLDIIGIYHSHTNNPAIPSECDRRLAWQHYSYLILSVHHGTTHDMRCWHLDEAHQFHEEPLPSPLPHSSSR